MSEIALIRPAIESLFDLDTTSPWPRQVLSNPHIVRTVSARKTLSECLDQFYAAVPNPAMHISEAVAYDHVPTALAVKLYSELKEFLDADTKHRRLLLYLPLELMPSSEWPDAAAALRNVARAFMETYLRHWHALLAELDIRANFVDGNILEPELAPNGQPRVVKAAHLIPSLIERGYLTQTDAEALLAAAANDVERQSIEEALTVVVPTASESTTASCICTEGDLLQLPEILATEREALDMHEARDHSRGMPPARVAWERSNNEVLLIASYAQHIADALRAQHITFAAVVDALMTASSVPMRLVLISGINSALSELSAQDHTEAALVFMSVDAAVTADMLDVPEISDELESMYTRLYNLGVVTDVQLRERGFPIPALDAGFQTESKIAYELSAFSPAVEALSSDPELASLIYPVVFFFGSRLKGYAKRTADLDAAVFVRPGVPYERRARIRERLQTLLPDSRIDGKVVEFWLEDSDEGLIVRDFPDPDVLLGDSSWVHLILGSVWLGPTHVLVELYETLLTNLLRYEGRTFEGADIHAVWLQELELDVLQYRLLHKGYARFFAPSGGVHHWNTPGVDPDSAYWDSGYRRVATKLYVNRVFVPPLVEQK